MPLIEVGRVCAKKYGRDASSRAVITKIIDGNFVEIISSSRPKPRKCNVKHLEFFNERIDANDRAAVAKAIEIDPSKLK
jgi:ribosomal protein L14E/L6E/L27E